MFSIVILGAKFGPFISGRETPIVIVEASSDTSFPLCVLMEHRLVFEDKLTFWKKPDRRGCPHGWVRN
jgi:hypothetical protein